jgi:hypothetical protein
VTPPRAFPPESYFQMELRGKLSHRQSWGTAEADEQEANLSESCDGVELEADCSSDDDSSECMCWFVAGREGEGRRRGEVLGWGHGQPAASRPPSSPKHGPRVLQRDPTPPSASQTAGRGRSAISWKGSLESRFLKALQQAGGVWVSLCYSLLAGRAGRRAGGEDLCPRNSLDPQPRPRKSAQHPAACHKTLARSQNLSWLGAGVTQVFKLERRTPPCKQREDPAGP